MNNESKPIATTTRSLADAPLETDPVCGMEFPRQSAPVETYYEGQRNYFCCEACMRRFEQEPARYLVSYVELI
jgi:YHS domain-containing protein